MAQGAGHFIGRADELGVLSGLVAGLDRHRPGALGLTGEPGIGKSRLLSEPERDVRYRSSRMRSTSTCTVSRRAGWKRSPMSR